MCCFCSDFNCWFWSKVLILKVICSTSSQVQLCGGECFQRTWGAELLQLIFTAFSSNLFSFSVVLFPQWNENLRVFINVCEIKALLIRLFTTSNPRLDWSVSSDSAVMTELLSFTSFQHDFWGTVRVAGSLPAIPQLYVCVFLCPTFCLSWMDPVSQVVSTSWLDDNKKL